MGHPEDFATKYQGSGWPAGECTISPDLTLVVSLKQGRFRVDNHPITRD